MDKPGIARSTLWNHIGKVAEYGLFFASTVAIARGLGVSGNGHLAAVLSLVQLIVVLSAAGVEVSLNKYIPQDGGVNPGTRYLVLRLLSLRLMLYVVVCVVALSLLPPGLSWRSVDGRELFGFVVVLGVLRSVAPVLGMLLVARFRTGQAALVGVLARGGELLALLWIGNSLTIPIVLVVLVGGTALQVCGYALASRVEWFGESRRIPVLPVVTFGAIFWVNTVIDYFLGRQGDVMFLAMLRPESTSASLYDVAYSIVQVGLLVLTAGFGGVSLAALSRHAATDPARMRVVYALVVRITSLLTIPLLSFLFVCAPDLLRLLYSEQYAGAVDALRIILVFRILSRLFATGENADYLLALGKVWTVVRIGVVAACVTVAMHLLLIPRWGAVGAACAGGTGVLLANVLGGVAVVRIGGVHLQWEAWIRIVAAAVTASVLCSLVPETAPVVFHFALTAAVFCAAFVLLMMVVRPLQKDDLGPIRAALGSLARPLHLFAGSR